MRRLLRICAVGLLMLAAARAAASDDVRVEGSRLFSAAQLRALLETGASGFPQTGAARIQDRYYREGYLFAAVTVSFDLPDSTWVFRIDEGDVARVRRSSVLRSSHWSEDELLSRLDLRPGAVFRPREFDKRVRELLAAYDEAGYPFAQVWIDSVGIDPPSHGVDVFVQVLEGHPRQIANVVFEGLTKTRPELAARIAGLQPGTPYRAHLLEDAYLRLVGSGVFEDVERPDVRLSPDGMGLDAVIRVDEPKRSHALTAAAGYAAAEEGQDRVINGLVDLRLNNIGGTLKDFQVFWTDDGRDRRETRVEYHDRVLFGRPLGLGVRLEQIGQDTLYTWQSVGVELERTAGRLGGTMVGISVAAHGDRNVFSVGTLLRSWRFRGTLGTSMLRGTKRRRGGFVEMKLQGTLARKQNRFRDTDSTVTLNQYIVEAQGEVAVPFWSRLMARVVPTYRGIESGEASIPLSEQFYVGGARTLRGYRENQFRGRRVATVRSELLIGPSRRENLYALVDAGYIWQESLLPDDTVERDRLWRVGYGFGIRTRSTVGNIDLSFAVGEKLSFTQTKVHVVLEQNF